MDIDGPIVLVDDDRDDHEVFREALLTFGIGNSQIRAFYDGLSALDYMITSEEKPFIIICDVNMPNMNGLDLRRKINENEILRKKSVPFIFMSTTAQANHVEEAYDLTVQGFFVKPVIFAEIRKSLELILGYWKDCVHPNSVNSRTKSSLVS